MTAQSYLLIRSLKEIGVDYMGLLQDQCDGEGGWSHDYLKCNGK